MKTSTIGQKKAHVGGRAILRRYKHRKKHLGRYGSLTEAVEAMRKKLVRAQMKVNQAIGLRTNPPAQEKVSVTNNGHGGVGDMPRSKKPVWTGKLVVVPKEKSCD